MGLEWWRTHFESPQTARGRGRYRGVAPQQGPELGPKTSGAAPPTGISVGGGFLPAPCPNLGTFFSVALLLVAPTPLASLGPWHAAASAQEQVTALSTRLFGQHGRRSADHGLHRPHRTPQERRCTSGVVDCRVGGWEAGGRGRRGQGAEEVACGRQAALPLPQSCLHKRACTQRASPSTSAGGGEHRGAAASSSPLNHQNPLSTPAGGLGRSEPWPGCQQGVLAAGLRQGRWS